MKLCTRWSVSYFHCTSLERKGKSVFKFLCVCDGQSGVRSGNFTCLWVFLLFCQVFQSSRSLFLYLFDSLDQTMVIKFVQYSSFLVHTSKDNDHPLVFSMCMSFKEKFFSVKKKKHFGLTYHWNKKIGEGKRSRKEMEWPSELKNQISQLYILPILSSFRTFGIFVDLYLENGNRRRIHSYFRT